tara:strand:+ start:1379 stop:1591 length:213 start_codon:yes stop_codon:yes gene_type:complete
MQIKLTLEEKEIIELEKSMEYLQQRTKTKTIRICVALFYSISRRHDILIKEKKILQNKITQLENYIKYNF